METTATTTKPVFAHEELLAEENLKVKDLPKPIRNKITRFYFQEKEFEKHPEDKKLEDKCVALSVEIADSIQDWIEKDAAEEPPENGTAPIKEKKQVKKDDETETSEPELNQNKETTGFYSRLFGRSI